MRLDRSVRPLGSASFVVSLQDGDEDFTIVSLVQGGCRRCPVGIQMRKQSGRSVAFDCAVEVFVQSSRAGYICSHL